MSLTLCSISSLVVNLLREKQKGGEGSFFWVAHIEEDVGGFEGAGRAGGTERGDEF
jgi:hypothetical protein